MCFLKRCVNQSPSGRPTAAILDDGGSLEARYKLIGQSGRFAGCEFNLGPGIHQVGRHSTNQVILAGDGSVSRTHARITISSAGITLEDLRSTNGTFLNGQKITRQPVQEGDAVRFGDAAFVLLKADGYSSSLPAAVPSACPEIGCGGAISPSGFCTVCGKRPLVCPECGVLNTADSRFCRADGIRLPPGPSGGVPARESTGESRIQTPLIVLPARSSGPRPGSREVDRASTAAAAATGTGSRPTVSENAGSRIAVPGATGSAAAPVAPPRRPGVQNDGRGAVNVSSRVLGTQDYPRCPRCGANVGTQSELCPRCHGRVRRCSAGHVSPASARVCVVCGKTLLPVAERWGVFRGASSSGWTPEAVRPPLRLAWKFRPPEGPVRWTSPILGDGTAFAAASDGFLYAMRGGIAPWRTPLDGPIRTDFVPETCVPAYSDGKVFVGHMGGALAAIDAVSGALLWQKDLPGRPSSAPRPATGALFLGVFTESGGGAVCSLGLDGSDRWIHETDSPVYSCPGFLTGSLIVTTAAGSILALEAASGRRIWQHTEQGDEFDTSAAASPEGIFATTRSGKLLCLDPRSGEVRHRWISPTGNYSHSSPAVGSGPTTGMVFFGADDRNIYVVSAESGRTISVHSTGGVVLGSPAITHDLAYVGSQDGRLYVIGPQTHQMEPAYKMSDGLHVASSPAVGDGQVLFAGSDGYLYALESAASVSRS